MTFLEIFSICIWYYKMQCVFNGAKMQECLLILNTVMNGEIALCVLIQLIYIQKISSHFSSLTVHTVDFPNHVMLLLLLVVLIVIYLFVCLFCLSPFLFFLNTRKIETFLSFSLLLLKELLKVRKHLTFILLWNLMNHHHKIQRCKTCK